jgi:hypothetical protein
MTSDQCTIIFITWAAYCHCMTKIQHHIWQTHQTPPRRPSQHAPNHCHHSMTKTPLYSRLPLQHNLKGVAGMLQLRGTSPSIGE